MATPHPAPLASNTAVQVRSGSYRGRTGITTGKPVAGLYDVILPKHQPAQGKSKAATTASFTRGQLLTSSEQAV